MFDFLKGKQDMIKVYAPMSGEVVPIQQVNDDTFRNELLGKGIAICPTDGNVFAPMDGKIELLFDTLHAFSMTSTQGVELLVHIGLDTVALKGKFYKAYKKTGDEVTKGDLILSVDLKAAKAAGYDMITPVVLLNSDEYSKITYETKKIVKPGELLFCVRK